MTVIRIEYNNVSLLDEEARALASAIREVVCCLTNSKDISVYANSSKIKIQVPPVEIFIEMLASNLSNGDALLADIKKEIVAWKKDNNFKHPINLMLCPMNWKVETGI